MAAAEHLQQRLSPRLTAVSDLQQQQACMGHTQHSQACMGHTQHSQACMGHTQTQPGMFWLSIKHLSKKVAVLDEAWMNDEYQGPTRYQSLAQAQLEQHCSPIVPSALTCHPQ